jgi:hypothetical protein
MVWGPPADFGNTSSEGLYDVLRSTSVTDFTSATCLESNSIDLVTIDSAEPQTAGTVFCYLTRAENECGEGNLGTRTFGGPPNHRDGTTCP